jgi:TldD protein
VDDEGVPAQRNILIENGRLCGYLSDRQSAQATGGMSTGSGRRQNYRYPPMPRMSNTFMLPGNCDPEEIVCSVMRGLYCANFGEGQVDITNGNFVFNALEAYMIDNGKLSTPVKNAMLIGNGPEILSKVSMVGNDLQLDQGLGTCSKEGQNVPVTVGIPTVKIDSIIVGGTRC